MKPWRWRRLVYACSLKKNENNLPHSCWFFYTGRWCSTTRMYEDGKLCIGSIRWLCSNFPIPPTATYLETFSSYIETATTNWYATWLVNSKLNTWLIFLVLSFLTKTEKLTNVLPTIEEHRQFGQVQKRNRRSRLSPRKIRPVTPSLLSSLTLPFPTKEDLASFFDNFVTSPHPYPFRFLFGLEEESPSTA